MAKPPATDPRRWKNTDPQKLQRIYETARQSLVRKFTDPQQRQKALARFDSDPRMQALRKKAGLATTTTRQRDVQDIAKARVDSRRKKQAQRGLPLPQAVRDFNEAMGAGVEEGLGLLGFDYIAAGIDRGLGALTGNQTSRDFDEALALYRAERKERQKASTAGNVLGQVGGGVIGGSAAAGAVSAGGRALTQAGATRAGNVLQGLTRLERGQTGRNALKVVAGGAAGGAAQAAGTGEDAGEGALYGAGGAAALGTGAKVGGWLAGKAGEALRVSGADAILRRYTKTTREELERRLSDFRTRTKSEPTIYELLDLEDRKSLQGVFGRLDRGQQERGAAMARERVEAIPGEVAQVVRTSTRQPRKENIRALASAQAEARGSAAPTTAEARLAVGAADNPTRLAQVRRNEARSIMAPYDERQAVESIEEMIPTEPRALNPNRPGEISEVEIDPEISRMIRAAVGTARLRPEGEGITVREMTDVISRLKEAAGSANSMIERGAAQRAADHLEGVLAERHPDVAPALARMNENWAARSRQLEGMREIRQQADVDPTTARRLQRSENVFETPEGGVGRAMAQRGELIDELGQANSPALGAVRQLAESPTRARQIAQNLGVPATRQITEAARAQSESARRLATAVRDPNFDAAEIEAGDLALLAAGLNPASMAYTKARAVMIAFERLGGSIPENRSRTIVDMLFSRDPAMTQRAVQALRSQGEAGNLALRDIVALGAASAPGSENTATPEAMPDEIQIEEGSDETDLSQLSDEELLAMYEGEETDLSQLSDEELLAMYEGEDQSSPYSQDLDALYDSEDPALLDLIERVSRQESGGNQFGSNGQPLTSSAGAIGVMQVMPDTAPEAARYAGLPWDPDAYKNDEAYNKLIGIAYLSEMLRRYDGDVELALVAYNAGPKRADAYSKGKISFSGLPEETQNYVRRILQ